MGGLRATEQACAKPLAPGLGVPPAWETPQDSVLGGHIHCHHSDEGPRPLALGHADPVVWGQVLEAPPNKGI